MPSYTQATKSSTRGGHSQTSPTNHIEIARQEAIIELAIEEINHMNVLKIIAFEEGFMSKPYLCSEGFVTIGLGTKLHKSKDMNPEDFPIRVSRKIAEEWLSTEVDIKHKKLSSKFGYSITYGGLDHDRRAIILSMAYQMGTAGVLRFKKMWMHLSVGAYYSAAEEMLDSKWARQTPERAERHARVMRGETLENVYTD